MSIIETSDLCVGRRLRHGKSATAAEASSSWPVPATLNGVGD